MAAQDENHQYLILNSMVAANLRSPKFSILWLVWLYQRALPRVLPLDSPLHRAFISAQDRPYLEANGITVVGGDTLAGQVQEKIFSFKL